MQLVAYGEGVELMAGKRLTNPAGSSNDLRGDVLRVLGVLKVATADQIQRIASPHGGFPLIVDTGCYAALVSVVDRCSKAIGLIWPRRECRRRVL